MTRLLIGDADLERAVIFDTEEPQRQATADMLGVKLCPVCHRVPGGDWAECEYNPNCPEQVDPPRWVFWMTFGASCVCCAVIVFLAATVGLR